MKINEVVEACRDAAEKMGNLDGNVLFPGWFYEGYPEEERSQCEAIRKAAAAILGNEENVDSGIYVHVRDVARLVHYIADMLEE